MILEKAAAMFMSKKIAATISDFAPDVIVFVHPLCNHLTTTILQKSEKKTPFVVVVTDPVTFHKSWLGYNRFINIANETAAAIVATDKGYERATKYGFPKEKLHLMGLPLRH